MSKKFAFWVFILGTFSSAVILAVLTWDTHRQVEALSHADKLSAQVVAGKRVWEKYNCNDCHTILGFGAYYGPDLTKVSRRIGDDGIRLRVKDPAKAFANSWRKMPAVGVTDEELDNLVAYFRWMGEIENGDWPPQDSKKRLSRSEERLVAGAGLSPGASVFQSRGCMNCHSMNGQGGSVGPTLDTVGQRLAAEDIKKLVRNPQSLNPDAIMPPQDELTDAEVEAVAGFLSSQK